MIIIQLKKIFFEIITIHYSYTLSNYILVTSIYLIFYLPYLKLFFCINFRILFFFQKEKRKDKKIFRVILLFI